MKQCWLREDKLPSNLLVNFSSKITKKINAIGVYNRQNGAALTQWSEYLDGMKSYLSKSVIAWDNMNRYPRLRNGGRFIGDFGYNVGYTIINDNATVTTCDATANMKLRMLFSVLPISYCTIN